MRKGASRDGGDDDGDDVGDDEVEHRDAHRQWYASCVFHFLNSETLIYDQQRLTCSC